MEKKKTLMKMSSRKKRSTSTNPSLPDDLLVSCFARVSRLHYPTFSLASKGFRSLLASPEVYHTRSSVGNTESCLYVCLQFHPDPNTHWFTLCRKPKKKKKKKKKKKTSEYALAPIQIRNFPPARSASVVSVGSNIYSVGSSIYKSPSSKVSILDCRTQTWREGPSMRVERYWSAANVFDGKIYVAGGCDDISPSNWIEVFDPETETWEILLCPLAKNCNSSICNSLVIENAICMFGYKTVAYKPKEDKWVMKGMFDYFNIGREPPYCVIDNVIYRYNAVQGIEYYGREMRFWHELRGLKRFPKFDSYGLIKLVDYGGQMAVLWDEFVPDSGDKMIWCAVIAIENWNKNGIWGKVKWCDVVLTVPVSCELICALASTV